MAGAAGESAGAAGAPGAAAGPRPGHPLRLGLAGGSQLPVADADHGPDGSEAAGGGSGGQRGGTSGRTTAQPGRTTATGGAAARRGSAAAVATTAMGAAGAGSGGPGGPHERSPAAGRAADGWPAAGAAGGNLLWPGDAGAVDGAGRPAKAPAAAALGGSTRHLRAHLDDRGPS